MVQPEASSPGGRWWEGYAIRYGVGTVVGGVLFYVLCTLNEALRPFLFDASENLESSHIALFAAYGFAYCYIASAPILVFHASRWMLKAEADLDELLIRLLIVLSVPLVVAASLYGGDFAASYSARLLFGVSGFILTLFVWLQFLAIASSLVRSRDLASFYLRLAEERKSANPELVESYRHLREHGNAFFVVFLEIAFALVLYAAGEFLHVLTPGASQPTVALSYVVVVVLWASPAVAIWFVGTAVERAVVERNGNTAKLWA